MITIRQHADVLRDERGGLEFKKLTNTSLPKLPYYDLTWDALHELRSKVKKGAQSILDVAEKESRSLNEDENIGFRFATDLLDAVNEDFEIRSERSTREPVDLSNKELTEAYHWGRSTERREISATENRAEYRLVHFANDPHRELSTDGFRSMAEFFTAVANGGRDSRLREASIESRTNTIGTGASGGFAVPEGYTEFLLDHALMCDEIVRPRALNLTMETPQIAAPAFDGDTRTSGIFGIRLKMYGEGTTIDVQTPQLRSQNIEARKGIIDWECTRELVQDSPGFDTRLRTLLPRVVARDLDDLFLFGDGVTEPMGISKCASTLGIARNTASSILYADIKNLWAKLHPACHKNAVWILNSTNIPELLALKDDANCALWQPGMNGNIRDGVPQTLYGRPILFCETSPALGTQGDLILCDLLQYICAFRQEMMIETSNAPGWSRDVVSFRLSLRFEGRPVFANPITLENGNTVSWAATINA
jgi:HK97 family phage major capsid protein